MLQFDLSAIDTQRIGRMGELVVELEILARGWTVGNFNATTVNSAGRDLFAVKGDRAAKVRVKAKRPGTSVFRWSARPDGSVLKGLDPCDPTDFVAAVDFQHDGHYTVYVLPSMEVEVALQSDFAAWAAGSKRDGTARKATSSMRHVSLDEGDPAIPGRGYARRWKTYHNAWKLLEQPSK